MKAIEQYFHVVLFIMLYKVVLTFKFVDETLVCDHSNERYCAVPVYGHSLDKILSYDHFRRNAALCVFHVEFAVTI